MNDGLPLLVLGLFDDDSVNFKSDSALAKGFGISFSSFSSAIDALDGRFSERFDIGCERVFTACKILCWPKSHSYCGVQTNITSTQMFEH